MTNLSARTWVLMGFSLSLIAVIINVFVLASFNEKIKDVDGELSKLNNTMATQATEMSRASMKYDFFKVLNHVAKLAKDEEKTNAEGDSIQMLAQYLSKNYAAVNDVPMNEYLRADNEAIAAQMQIVDRIKPGIALMEQGKIEEGEKIVDAGVKEFDEWQPKDELGKRLADSEKLADREKLAGMNTSLIYWEILPALKEANDQFIGNYQKKQDRIKELQDKKSNLSGWQSMFTYLAVSLQLFGLMFVLTKDLVKDTKERRDKARKETEKAEEEARQSEIEAAEAKARARQAGINADEAEAKAEQRIEEANEAIDEAIERADAAKEEADKLLEEEDEEAADEKTVKV